MKKGKNFIVPCVIYPYEIMFSFGEDDKTLKRKLERRGVNTSNTATWVMGELTEGRAAQFGGRNCLVRMKMLPKTPRLLGTLAHEIFHVVTFIMDTIKTPMEMDKTDECYSHLLGYITEQVYKKL